MDRPQRVWRDRPVGAPVLASMGVCCWVLTVGLPIGLVLYFIERTTNLPDVVWDAAWFSSLVCFVAFPILALSWRPRRGNLSTE